MSLITTCPACHTSFRVVTEQLSAHRGDVRCGQCQHIFNALKLLEEVPGEPAQERSLEDTSLESSAPVTMEATEYPLSDDVSEPTLNEASTETPGHIGAPEENPASVVSSDLEDREISLVDEEAFAEVAHQTSEETDLPNLTDMESPHEDVESTLEESDVEISGEDFDGELTPLAIPDTGDDIAQESEVNQPDVETPQEETEAQPLDFALAEATPVLSNVLEAWDATPSIEAEAHPSEEGQNFEIAEKETASEDDVIDVTIPLPEESVSQDNNQVGPLPDDTKNSEFHPSESAKHEDEPPAKGAKSSWGLVLLVMLLLLGAFGQAAFFLRTEITVFYPPARPWLEQACRYLSCKVELPRQADLLNIEDSDLQADTQHEGVLVLVSALYNRAPYAQAYPLLEVTLTDTYDKPILRRTLMPQEYLPPETNIASGIPANGEAHSRLYLNVSGEKPAGYRLFVRY